MPQSELGLFADQPPKQIEIRQLEGSPQGVYYAEAGYLIVDWNGHLYVKQSPKASNTGWAMVV
jgi:hypothetical protein